MFSLKRECRDGVIATKPRSRRKRKEGKSLQKGSWRIGKKEKKKLCVPHCIRGHWAGHIIPFNKATCFPDIRVFGKYFYAKKYFKKLPTYGRPLLLLP